MCCEEDARWCHSGYGAHEEREGREGKVDLNGYVCEYGGMEDLYGKLSLGITFHYTYVKKEKKVSLH